jgi:hypothetical protein
MSAHDKWPAKVEFTRISTNQQFWMNPLSPITRLVSSTPKFGFSMTRFVQELWIQQSTQPVMDQCLRDATDQMVAHLPNFRHIKRTIQRQRNVNALPQIPHDKTCPPVPATVKIKEQGETCLQHDSGLGKYRILIFSSHEQWGILKVKLLTSFQVDNLLYSLIQMAPAIFNQLYTLHGIHRVAVLPLLFTLLSDKQQVT